MVSQASSENNSTFAVRNADADLAVRVLDEEFALERAQGDMSDTVAEKDLATVAIVGENMKRTPGIAGKLFGTLGSAGISVIACAQGASETNISFVIKLKYQRKALNSIHDSFFLSQNKFPGSGNRFSVLRQTIFQSAEIGFQVCRHPFYGLCRDG